MGDRERPEEAGPEQEEVNVTAAFPLVSQSALLLDCRLWRGLARCRTAMGKFSPCCWKPRAGPAWIPG